MPGLLRTTSFTPEPPPTGEPILDLSFGSPVNPGVAKEANEFVTRAGCLLQSYDATSINLMVALGCKSMRLDPQNLTNPALNTLKNAGVRFMVHAGVYNQEKGTTPVAATVLRDRVKAVGPQYFIGMSNVNEPNLNKKIVNPNTYWPYLRNYQQTLYNTFKADPETRDVPVLGPGWAFIQTDNIPNIGNIDAWIDGHEIHTYPRPGWAPEQTGAFSAAPGAFQTGSSQKPVLVGEMGWPTDPALGDYGGYDPIVKKDEMMPRHWLYHFDHGIAAMVNFMMTNTTAGSGWAGGDPDSYGWVKSSGLTQPSYQTCKRLLSLLADPGVRHTTERLNYSVAGSITNVHHTLLQKRNGRWYLCIWVGLYANATRNVTITIPDSINFANRVRPNVNALWEMQTINNHTITTTLDNKVTIFELYR